MLTKKKIIIGFFFLLGLTSNYNASSTIILIGDEIEYDNKTKIVTAKKNVKLNFSSFKIKTNRCEFDINKEEVKIPKTFKLIHNKIDLKGENLNYSFKKMQGNAASIESKIDKVFLKGDEFRINDHNIQFKKTSFSSCDKKEHKHYTIKADDIYIYPQWGYLISNNNFLHVYDVPIFWFPSFPYGSKKYSLLEKSSPIPDIGSNQREGLFIKENINFQLSPNLSGQFHIGYLEKLGLTYGISQAYSVNDEFQIEAKLQHLGKDGWAGGSIINWDVLTETKQNGSTKPEDSISVNVNKDIEKILGTFDTEKLPLSNLKISYLVQELTYDYRVDLIPQVQLRINPIKLTDNIEITSLVEAGKRREENPTGNIISASLFLAENTVVINNEFLNNSVQLNNRITNQYNKFNGNQNWLRSFYSIELNLKKIYFSPSLSFTKKFVNLGRSPFELDQKYKIQSDEWGLNLFQEFGDVFLGVKGNFPINKILKEIKPRYLEVKVGAKIHCIVYELYMLPIEKQIRFGVNLF